MPPQKFYASWNAWNVHRISPIEFEFYQQLIKETPEHYLTIQLESARENDGKQEFSVRIQASEKCWIDWLVHEAARMLKRMEAQMSVPSSRITYRY